MPTFRIVSPERRWRAGALVLLAALVAWRVFSYAGPDHDAGRVLGSLVAGSLLVWVIPVMRTCLIVTDAGLTDHRALRSVQVPWTQIARLRVARPNGPWGGFCVVVTCRDGTLIDLLLTRAYSRVPFSAHLDEVQRICWTLEERLATRGQNPPSGP